LRDVATDQQNQAAVANLQIDRDTAARLGVSASAVDNTLYSNADHHPYWGGGVDPNPELGVYLLDILELKVAPCTELTNSLTVLFTAAHPNLGAVNITMTGPGGPFAFSLPAPLAGQQFGTAVPAPPAPLPGSWTVASLAPCAYIVGLSVQVLLTTGDGVPSDLYDQIAFCKM